ncbi:MAG TPA: DUF3108 domain-containing protein [Candidatus Omnitrophota bacterium]|nr:DUF3108 domain-containing protein [Candidatus Omnitrophota bacterium]HPT07729.1 DUF3108 domain-containing protein [Candidatus Omnitrophota bacterium]
MKKIACFLIVCAAIVNAAYAQNFKATANDEAIIPFSDPQGTITTGETLSYIVEWLGVPVGHVIFTSEKQEVINGYACYHVVARSFPNRYLRKIYDLEYTVHTYIDVQALSPRRFIKIRRFDQKTNTVQVDFDLEKGEAVSSSLGDAGFVNVSKRRDEIKTETSNKFPPHTQDLLSFFYYFRLTKIEPDTLYPLNVYYNQSNWLLQIRSGRPFYRELHGKGRFPVSIVSIGSSLNDYILGKEKFCVTLMTDARRIPIEFKFGTALGPIRAIIREVPPQDGAL